MHEALNLYIEEPVDSEELPLFPDKTISLTENIVEVALDPEIATACILRYNQLQK